jgi:hypothetical protein
MLRIICDDPDKGRFISALVDGYGSAFRSWLDAAGIVIRVLRPEQRYADVSRVVRGLSTSVDSWPSPPTGLFVREERAVCLRVVSPVTIAHELVHAYDCARGAGVYFSSADPRTRALYSQARAFVTPYAASGLDEYFAESGRCFHPGGHDPRSPWPRATRARLRRIDPAMEAFLASLFAEPAPLNVAA